MIGALFRKYIFSITYEKILIFLAFSFFYRKGMVIKYICTNFQKNWLRDEVVRADGVNLRGGGKGGGRDRGL